jgi:hypothetical protein
MQITPSNRQAERILFFAKDVSWTDCLAAMGAEIVWGISARTDVLRSSNTSTQGASAPSLAYGVGDGILPPSLPADNAGWKYGKMRQVPQNFA